MAAYSTISLRWDKWRRGTTDEGATNVPNSSAYALYRVGHIYQLEKNIRAIIWHREAKIVGSGKILLRVKPGNTVLPGSGGYPFPPSFSTSGDQNKFL